MDECMTYEISTDEIRSYLPELHAGDRVLLSGRIYTSRDAAHKRICEALDNGSPLPYDLRDAIIYYAGPTPARPGMAVGSCGPTTAGRMDCYAPRLLELGLAAMIGKGDRSNAVVDAIRRNGAVYFAAVGGAGALIAKHITASTVVGYEDLGCESAKQMQVDRLPLIVAIDSQGDNLYRTGRLAYQN